MNPEDDELNPDTKVKLPTRESKSDVEFIKALTDRSLGFSQKKNVFTGYNLQACAEDELIKKQFKEMRCEMPGLPRSTFLMVFSPDGTKVASTHGNHHIYVSDVRTGKHIKILEGHPRTPWCIAFHPTSNQIIASGCLGGQVRIWDLSGGSEVWTTESQTVIASIAFHPNDRLLVIATYNELLFWDWSKAEPFMHVTTGSVKEKVRYVAFDKLGHKLITGITNTPQTRWERVRAPVPVPRQAEGSASHYRRRITPRLVTNLQHSTPVNNNNNTNNIDNNRELTLPRPSMTEHLTDTTATVPERERRITACYRNLVQEYEVLVHRYLQIYRPPVMVDQGTDPMDFDELTGDTTLPTIEARPCTSTNGINVGASTSVNNSDVTVTTEDNNEDESIPSTSGTQEVLLKKSSASKPAKNKSKKLTQNSSDETTNTITPNEIESDWTGDGDHGLVMYTHKDGTRVWRNAGGPTSRPDTTEEDAIIQRRMSGGIVFTSSACFQQMTNAMLDPGLNERIASDINNTNARASQENPIIPKNNPTARAPARVIGKNTIIPTPPVTTTEELFRILNEPNVPIIPSALSIDPIIDEDMPHESNNDQTILNPASPQTTPSNNNPSNDNTLNGTVPSSDGSTRTSRVDIRDPSTWNNIFSNPIFTVAPHRIRDTLMNNITNRNRASDPTQLNPSNEEQNTLQTTSVSENTTNGYGGNRANSRISRSSSMIDLFPNNDWHCRGLDRYDAASIRFMDRRNRNPSPPEVRITSALDRNASTDRNNPNRDLTPTSPVDELPDEVVDASAIRFGRRIATRFDQSPPIRNSPPNSSPEIRITSASDRNTSVDIRNAAYGFTHLNDLARMMFSSDHPRDTSRVFTQSPNNNRNFDIIAGNGFNNEMREESGGNSHAHESPMFTVARRYRAIAAARVFNSYSLFDNPPNGPDSNEPIFRSNEPYISPERRTNDGPVWAGPRPIVSIQRISDVFSPDRASIELADFFTNREESSETQSGTNNSSSRLLNTSFLQRPRRDPRTYPYQQQQPTIASGNDPQVRRRSISTEPIPIIDNEPEQSITTDTIETTEPPQMSHEWLTNAPPMSTNFLPTPSDLRNLANLRRASRTTGSTQTVNNDIDASLSSTSTEKRSQQPSTSQLDFRIRIHNDREMSLSSSEDEYVEEVLNQHTNAPTNVQTVNESTSTQEENVLPENVDEQAREAAVCRYLNLARRGETELIRERPSDSPTCRVTMTRRVLKNPTVNQSEPSSSNKNDTTTTQSASKSGKLYKMRIKCSLPNNNAAEAGPSQKTNQDATNTVKPEPSQNNTHTTSNDNISDLIRNAELMLAKFRENLEQRGHLQGIHLPSTSRSLLSQTRPKPSKGTNTHDSDTQSGGNARKRNHSKGNRRPILDSSSDSSSEDENIPKRVKNTESTNTNDVVTNNNNNTPVIENNLDDLSNEHSYAGLTEGSNTEGTVRIEINLPTNNPEEQRTLTTLENRANTSRRPYNLNAELVLLVTDLLDNDDRTPTTSVDAPPTNEEEPKFCKYCMGALDTPRSNALSIPRCIKGTRCRRNANSPINGESSNNMTIEANDVPTTTSANTTTPLTDSPNRRRFYSHRLSAFYPTRLNNSRVRRNCPRHPLNRSRLGSLANLTPSPPQSNSNFAPDEVINYAERANEEETRNFHPFFPDFAVNPENIGIGNMYSNIVQELESSLNEARNIRANRRIGETSVLLSSFSERLESIMRQSNAILRNLSSSMDTPPTPQPPLAQTPQADTSDPQLHEVTMPGILRSLRTSGLLRNSDSFLDLDAALDVQRNLYNNNPIASDHTYPINSGTSAPNNMSPLMASLHLTVSHIQRQARRLRQQVESIERIDRAMLEVMQLQLMRQILDELHRHFTVTTATENREGVSNVRQMMAGTSISDSTRTTDEDNDVFANEESADVSQPSTSNSAQEVPTNASGRARARKTYPRCIFLMHRQYRRQGLGFGARRNERKDRTLRRNIYRRFLPSRTNSRPPADVSSVNNRGRGGYLSILSPDTLPSMTRRLEHFLMEHGRFIGRLVPPTPPTTYGTHVRSDVGEHYMMLRIINCRVRMNRCLRINTTDSIRTNHPSVTNDGSSRFGARQTLSSILDTLTRYMESTVNSNVNTYRAHITEVIEFSLLLCDILLLQIVDSIPPPSGMNLDPERESLSARIDLMCSRMLQSRLIGQSYHLTRSLRLMRLTVRHASQALGQTYTARRNAMLPSNNNDNEPVLDTRQGLLLDIHNCLRNIRRSGASPAIPPPIGTNNHPVSREWYRTINYRISRYNTQPPADVPCTSSTTNNETGEETRTNPAVTVEDGNSSDDNVTTSNNANRERVSRPLYRTNNVNLLHNEESSPSGSSSGSSRNRLWTVPIVHVNDVPVSEPQYSPWHPRFVANRQRLNERLDELRTTSGLFRPRFLHPLYGGGVNPFDADMDDAQRDPIYDSDIIATVTPNHRIQAWEFSKGIIPNISNAGKNVVVNECKIHNDASVDYASDGTILVTLLPSGGYMNITNRLGVYSLEWETLGQCLYVTSFEQNAVSVSLSPMNRHLVVGLASRRVTINPSDKWTMARIFLLDEKEASYGRLSPIRELEQNRDTSYMSVNCIRWLPTSGQGLVFATNTGHLRFLT